jgi:hypothetical protein
MKAPIAQRGEAALPPGCVFFLWGLEIEKRI